MDKIHYGYDAPGIMRNLILFGALGILASTGFIQKSNHPGLQVTGYLIAFAGIVFFTLGLAMLAYGLKGKYRTRDFMLSRIEWTGKETVLDVGTGQGMLMNGAAKRLTSGKAYGIDTWSKKDLSNNSLSRTLQNAELEGVSDRIEIRNDDARKLSFPDESFDVVLSLLCIHNIEPKEDQEKACFEISRVLKPGGVALIGDYVPTTDYARAFEKAGLTVKSSKAYFATAYALMWIVEAHK
jgi:arsenite methyltransferase